MNVKLQNVRLSYPNLFEPKAGKDNPNKLMYGCSILLSKTDSADQIEAMRNGILAAATEQWGAGNVKWNGPKLFIKKSNGNATEVKVCLRDGSDKPETDGYGDGVMFFSASNKSAPAVVDKNPNIRLTKDSGKPYAGCYVNVAIRLWAQDNDFGRRINAQLQAIQFHADGESFGDAPIDPANVFTNTSGEENPFMPDSSPEEPPF